MKWLIDPAPFNLDCGDNSCRYAAKKGGMRTNGGCRCHLHTPREVERFLLANYHAALKQPQEESK